MSFSFYAIAARHVNVGGNRDSRYNPRMRIALPENLFKQMLNHVQAVAPEEACGLLGGDAQGLIRALYITENLRHSPVEYEMSPTDQIAAMLAMEAQGWELAAIYHSHPAGPAVPSATDIRRAYYPEAAYVICAPDTIGQWAARVFQIQAGQVTELDLQVLPAQSGLS